MVPCMQPMLVPGLPVICLPGAMGTAETDCEWGLQGFRMWPKRLQQFVALTCTLHFQWLQLIGGGKDFAPQLDGLSQRHGVIAFDPRGYGKPGTQMGLT